MANRPARVAGTHEGVSMVKEICKDDEVLGKKCARATAEDADVAQDVVDTMRSVEDCTCLAANQIGVIKSVVAYLDDEGGAHVMYNPHVMMGLQAARVTESCLSRDEPVKATRYAKVKVRYEELVDGKLVQRTRDFTGWTAQMIQHMCDHCRGKLV
jgi:peptide deformylase